MRSQRPTHFQLLRCALGFGVSDQRGKDRGSLVKGFLALFHLFHRKTLLYKTRIVLASHEAMRVHHGLVEGDVCAYTYNPILLQRPTHA